MSVWAAVKIELTVWENTRNTCLVQETTRAGMARITGYCEG
jgi:hypothetical protein